MAPNTIIIKVKVLIVVLVFLSPEIAIQPSLQNGVTVMWNPARHLSSHNKNDSLVNNDYNASTIPAGDLFGPEEYRKEMNFIIERMCGVQRMCSAYDIENAQWDEIRSKCSWCEQCSCDLQTCVLYGDCCPDLIVDDFIDRITGSNPNKLSSHGDCYDLRITKATLKFSSIRKERLISICPMFFDDHDIATNCQIGSFIYGGPDPEDKANNMKVIWPVSSSLTNLSYRNEACALCHGESIEFLVSWNLDIKCSPRVTPKPKGLTQLQTLHHFLGEKLCQVSFVHPEGKIGRRCEDNVFKEEAKIVRRCNVFGQKMKFEPMLWNACESMSGVYFNRYPIFLTSRRTDVFANPFCTLCQTDDPIWPRPPLCRRTRPINYFFLITLSSVDNLGPAEKSASCACLKFQVMDPYTKKCRDVICPEGYRISLNTNGTRRDFWCEDDRTNSNGFTYSLDLKLTSNFTEEIAVDIDFLTTICRQLENEIVSNLMQYTSLKQLTIRAVFSYYDLTVENNTNPLTLFIAADMENVKTVHTANLVSDLMALTQKTFHVQISLNKSAMNITFLSSATPGLNRTAVRSVTDIDEDGNVVPITGVFGSVLIVDLRRTHREIFYFEEVKKTLQCPYLVVDEDFEKDLRLEKILFDEDSGIVNDELRLIYAKTGLVIDYTDIVLTPDGRKIICAEKFIDIWQNIEDLEQVDKDEDSNVTDGLYLSSTLCLSFSCVCFLITLMTYILFPSLRTLPGLNTMSLVVTMFLTMVLVLFTPLIETNTVFCQIVGVATHFFLLSSVTWMMICTLRTYIIFTNLFSHSRGVDNSSKLYLRYLIISTLIPAIVVAVTISVNRFVHTHDGIDNDSVAFNRLVTGHSPYNATVDGSQGDAHNEKTDYEEHGDLSAHNEKTDNEENGEQSDCGVTSSSNLTPIGYGEGVCYISNQTSVLLAAGLPILLANLFNAVLFCLTLLALRKVTSDQKVVQRDSKEQLIIYIKLSALTGLNWLPGLLSSIIDSPVFFYAFNILAGLQGFCVLAAFVLNKRVLNMYKVKLCGEESNPRSRSDVTTKASEDLNDASSSTRL